MKKLYTESRNHKGKVHFRLSYDDDRRIFYATWIGYQQMDDIKRGATKIINFLKQDPGKYISFINDLTDMKKMWANANDKLGGFFVPKIAEQGVKYQAEIKTDEQLLSSANNHFPLINAGNTEVNIFKDEEDALMWLISKNELIVV
ncbi:MAG: hypothetical protein KTR26_04595 [Flammeovirgaceae bacterium]|nr:hypothetical protein [Flammeovirgaceae bacterium]